MTWSDWPGRDGGNVQFNPSSATTHSANATATERAKSADGSARPRYRYSLPEPVPAVPAIPEHHLASGKRATLFHRRKGDDARKESTQPLSVPSSPVIHIQRPSTSHGEELKNPPLRAPSLRDHAITSTARTPTPADHARRKSLPSLATLARKETLDKLENRSQHGTAGNMSRLGRGRNEDLFLELANDQAENGVRPPSRSERVSSRLSFSGKRRSLPAQTASPSTTELRPRTSGAVFANRPSSRIETHPSDLQRHVERYRNTPSRAGFTADDAVSVSTRSRSGRPQYYSAVAERKQAAEQVRSPEMPQYGRRRPSFGSAAPSQPYKTRPSQLSSRPQDTYSESPADSSDPKQSLPDSSAESQEDDTVWDELDDLKSRIKKLELTGKLPQTSGAAVSNETSDRPRTATTAPTTIDSSPKHEKQEKKPQPEAEPEDAPAADSASGPTTANIHPLLHAALAKAKPLLNGTLYRSLEATAADALQLAAMTGSAGPQGTAYSAAAIINGLTVGDRHVRRKADTMCRNLTDLCLALCEGKNEPPSIASSPVTLNTPAKSSPSVRYPRNSLDPNDAISRNGARPMSRLEARRTSILGSQAGSSLGNSPAASGEELSASEQESTPSNLRSEGPRRFSRAGSRLQTARMQRYNEAGDDEDPTIRPVSRAMTDIGRAKPAGPREYHTPPQQRSASLRDSLVARRANAGAHEENRELSRVASLNSNSGSRRRFHDPSTPPVLEEEGSAEDYQPSSSSQPKRRIMSFGQYASRRTATDLPSRATSLTQRRHIVVE